MASPPPKASFNSDSRDSASPYGVLDFLAWNHDWNGNHYPPELVHRAAQLMAKAGIGWVRMDFLWADLEPHPNEFSFEKYDALVKILRQAGLSVLGILHYNPLWRHVPWNSAPDPAAYLRYATAVVAHFRDRVRYWEIWNEPDQDIYWVPQDNLAAYSRLLREVTPALKKADPTCRVLMGSLSKEIPQRLLDLYRQAGPEAFDIVNLHPFVNPLNPDAIAYLTNLHESVRKIMADFKDEGKPIWWTEIGCPGIAKGQIPRGWWLEGSPTEKEQADWVTRLYAHRKNWAGVEKIFWAFFRDTADHFHNDIDHFGLVRQDLTLKPAYEVYCRMTATERGSLDSGFFRRR